MHLLHNDYKIIQPYTSVCAADPEHARTEDASGGDAHGQRVPALSEGHELQGEDEGAF